MDGLFFLDVDKCFKFIDEIFQFVKGDFIYVKIVLCEYYFEKIDVQIGELVLNMWVNSFLGNFFDFGFS